MEDAHTAVLDLSRAHDSHAPESQDPSNAQSFETKESLPNVTKKPAFFAVYDGHGGSNVARYTGATLYARLGRSESFKNKNWNEALVESFLNTDEALKQSPELSSDPSGCTAVCVLITPPAEEHQSRKIICANAGDSRAILSLSGNSFPMSYDHKPQNESENDRIVKAGGFVEIGRVNGNLALSRAIGDFEFKQNQDLPPQSQIVTAVPDIIDHECTGEEEFVVLACDGIWDCLSSQSVIDIVRRSIANGEELKDICGNIMDKCLAPDSELGGIGCDNMTICIVGILGNRTKEEWYEWIKSRVDNGIGRQTPESVPDVFQKSDYDHQDESDSQNFKSFDQRFATSPLSILSNMAGASGSSLQEALDSGGIVFQPSGAVTNKDGQLVYASISDSEPESDDDESLSDNAESSEKKIKEIEEDESDNSNKDSDKDNEDKDLSERQIKASGGLIDQSDDPVKTLNLSENNNKSDNE